LVRRLARCKAVKDDQGGDLSSDDLRAAGLVLGSAHRGSGVTFFARPLSPAGLGHHRQKNPGKKAGGL
jgi:hypothetical protein